LLLLLLLWFVELSPNIVLRNMYWCFVITVVWYTVIHFGIVTGYTTTHTTTTTRTAITRHHHHHHHQRRRLSPVTMTPTIIAATSLSSLRRTSGWTHATIAAATMLLMRPRNSILASNSHAEDADTDVDPNDATLQQQQQQQQPRIVYDLGIGPASVSDTHDHDDDGNNSTTTSSGTTMVNSRASVVGMHWMAPAAVIKPVPNHGNQKNHHRSPVPPLAAATATETNSSHKKSRRMVAYVYIVLCVCVCVFCVCEYPPRVDSWTRVFGALILFGGGSVVVHLYIHHAPKILYIYSYNDWNDDNDADDDSVVMMQHNCYVAHCGMNNIMIYVVTISFSSIVTIMSLWIRFGTIRLLPPPPPPTRHPECPIPSRMQQYPLRLLLPTTTTTIQI
jgi:hypothetical protein